MNQAIFGNKLRLILVLVIALIGMVALYLLTTPAYKKIHLYQTPFMSDSLSAVKGDSIYSYSGMSFYKTNLENQADVTVLNYGLRLPTIEQLHWAQDKGVFMVFGDGGFIGSVLETELTSRGKEWDEKTRDYLWYLDFKSNKLNLVSEQGLASPATFYSPENSAFYFHESPGIIPESDVPGDASIRRYSTELLSSEVIIQDTGALNEVEYIGNCIDTSTICYMVNKDGYNQLQKIIGGGETESLFTEEGFDYIFPSSSPNFFIGIKKQDTVFESTEEAVLRGGVYKLDPSSQTSSSLGSEVSLSSSILTNGTPESFYIFDPNPVDTTQLSYLAGAKNTLGQLKVARKNLETTQTNEAQSQSVSTPISRTDSGYTMFHSVEGSAYLITPGSKSYQASTQSQKTTETNLKPCFDTYTKGYIFSEEIRQFKVNILYDEIFATKIRDFAKCANEKSPASIVSYSFVFVGVSPFDGRFVTD